MEETLKLILDKLLNSMDSDIKDIKDDTRNLKNHVTVIEDKLDNNSKALFDGYKQVYEKVTEMEKKIETP